MAKRKPVTIALPPFPTLHWDAMADAWEAVTALSHWAGFWDGRPSGRRKMSDGSIRLQIRTPGDRLTPPSAEQLAAYRLILDRGESIRDAMLKAVCRKYSAWRRRVIQDEMLDPDEMAEDMPVEMSSDRLKSIVGVGTLYIHPVASKGRAYVGFAFYCTWDIGHGFGVMTHGKRVVGVSDDSELAWDTAASRQDAERRRGSPRSSE